MSAWIVWNGETRRLYVVSAYDEDEARDKVAGPDSDGDELSIALIEGSAEPEDITEELGIE